MQAMILNSGVGSRMGDLTSMQPKCMVEIVEGVSLIAYQVDLLHGAGIDEIVITTGYLADVLVEYLRKRYHDGPEIRFVHNPKYADTNYIMSMHLASGVIHEDLVLLHGDLFFEEDSLRNMLALDRSAVVVDSTLPLPVKDFKAQVGDDRVQRIATYIDGKDCVACQPLYRLCSRDWSTWSESIAKFCTEGRTGVYGEDALNAVLDRVKIVPFDLHGKDLCMEVDTREDLEHLRSRITKGGIKVE